MALSKSYLIAYNNERRHYTFIEKKTTTTTKKWKLNEPTFCETSCDGFLGAKLQIITELLRVNAWIGQ